MEANTLRLILLDNGIKQTWLAEKLGIKKAQVNQWVKGTSTIPDKYIIEIKRLLPVKA